jgi:hypothetical protein
LLHNDLKLNTCYIKNNYIHCSIAKIRGGNKLDNVDVSAGLAYGKPVQTEVSKTPEVLVSRPWCHPSP